MTRLLMNSVEYDLRPAWTYERPVKIDYTAFGSVT